MKTSNVYLLVTCLISAALITSCKKNDRPTVSTLALTELTVNSIQTGGVVSSDGGAEVTVRGVCWSTKQQPSTSDNMTSDGTGVGEFTSIITELEERTTYYVRAFATNSEGTSYGEEISFTTSAGVLATVTTTPVTSITPASIVTGGNVTNDGKLPVTEHGVVWGTSKNPTIDGNHTTDGTGSGEFTSNIGGLAAGTVYYVRSYATNAIGTAYGNEIRFITPVADVEGNVYKTTQIGDQIWMAENLRTTRYNNDTPIPQVANSTEWVNQTTPAYSWYSNDESNKQLGALYNWFTVATGNLCPQGWHVPTNAEYEAMEIVAGIPADSIAVWGWRGKEIGTKLKSPTGWSTGGGTNTLDFSASGTGYRSWTDGQFRAKNEIAYYWTATDDAVNGKPNVAYYRRLDGTSQYIYKGTTGKASGKSIRCVKNQ